MDISKLTYRNLLIRFARKGTIDKDAVGHLRIWNQEREFSTHELAGWPHVSLTHKKLKDAEATVLHETPEVLFYENPETYNGKVDRFMCPPLAVDKRTGVVFSSHVHQSDFNDRQYSTLLSRWARMLVENFGMATAS